MNSEDKLHALLPFNISTIQRNNEIRHSLRLYLFRMSEILLILLDSDSSLTKDVPTNIDILIGVVRQDKETTNVWPSLKSCHSNVHDFAGGAFDDNEAAPQLPACRFTTTEYPIAQCAFDTPRSKVNLAEIKKLTEPNGSNR
ncbi:Hypothetical predicted protein, partial [Paramuricea clavata]